MNAFAVLAQATINDRVGERTTTRRITAPPTVRPSVSGSGSIVPVSVGLRVRRAAARASPRLPSPANPSDLVIGFAYSARATS